MERSVDLLLQVFIIGQSDDSGNCINPPSVILSVPIG